MSSLPTSYSIAPPSFTCSTCPPHCWFTQIPQEWQRKREREKEREREREREREPRERRERELRERQRGATERSEKVED
jgi:uncharacterized protein (DUF2225 family)